jgi:CRISPR/Cas system CMR subunit Cmr6 (Cas7 group RAMP superfamily)
MSILMPKDTEAALGKNAVLAENRTWLLTRSLVARDSVREQAQTIERVGKLAPAQVFLEDWRQFVARELELTPELVLFGALKSRLLFHGALAAPIAEFVVIDRLSGLPLIPGSACKGCARQAAIREFMAATKPEEKIELLTRIALVFGWSPRDWESDSAAADALASSHARTGAFVRLCGADAPNILPIVRRNIQQRLCQSGPPADCSEPAPLRGFAGAVHFLASKPWRLPARDLEPDIASNHHLNYYHQREGYDSAPDAEPVAAHPFFTLAPGHLFAFVILGETELVRLAQTWLAAGLSVFGLGARKSAGYGWFEVSAQLQQPLRAELQALQTEWRQKRVRKLAETRERERQEAEALASIKLAERMKSLSEEELLDYDLLQLKEVQFWGKVQKFHALDDEGKKAMIRVLQGQRSDLWRELKLRAARGGQWGRVENAIRQFSRENDLGKMP